MVIVHDRGVDLHLLINVSTYLSILSIFPFIPMFLVYSLLIHFPLSNASCGSSYHQVLRYVNPQSNKYLLIHFSQIQHVVIFMCYGSLIARDQPIPVPQLLMSYNPQLRNTQNDLSTYVSSKLHCLPSLYLANYLNVYAGQLSIPLTFSPHACVPQPTILCSTK